MTLSFYGCFGCFAVAKDQQFLKLKCSSATIVERYPQADVYKMRAQFKIDGKVHTADFTVDVTEGKRRKRREVARSSTLKSLILDVEK